MNATIKLLSERYSGRGRPKKTDYDNKTIFELQDEVNIIYNKKVDFNLLAINKRSDR